MNSDGPRVEQVETPALVIDLDKVEANLRRGAELAAASGAALRPHTKTHKTPYFGRMQIEYGARGLTVAKVGEAEVMAEAGLDDLFIANTVFGEEKARRIRRLASAIHLTVGVDHIAQARLFAEAMTGAERPLSVMIEVDTGARRGGVAPEEAAGLAREVAALPGLVVRGAYTYEGYTGSAQDRDGLVRVHREGQQRLVAAGRAVGEAVGVNPIISAGSTPGLFSGAPYLPGITEVRPGTYIFFDASQVVFAGGPENVGAWILATVVSRPSSDRAILDAGSKTLTSDTGPSGMRRTVGHGWLPDQGLHIVRMSEEHGVVEGTGVEKLAVGQKVRIFPNHICPVVNLFNEVTCIRDGVVQAVLPVAARGRLQ